ncbi:hypothetical protein HOD29_05510 [archaeon]|jgi:hypothetical protein|nr:hypothetical protein [archaeon]
MNDKKPLRLYSPISSEYSLFEKPEDFIKFKLENNLKLGCGLMTNPKILERKRFSNKGNALDGFLLNSNGAGMGLNIGGNPIGTGWKQYIPFLEEMGCKKTFGLYDLNSIKNKLVGYLFKNDTRWGIFVPESLNKFLK